MDGCPGGLQGRQVTQVRQGRCSGAWWIGRRRVWWVTGAEAGCGRGSSVDIGGWWSWEMTLWGWGVHGLVMVIMVMVVVNLMCFIMAYITWHGCDGKRLGKKL